MLVFPVSVIFCVQAFLHIKYESPEGTFGQPGDHLPKPVVQQGVPEAICYFLFDSAYIVTSQSGLFAPSIESL